MREHLKNVSLFVTCIYVRYWFQTPSATTAPRNDLALLYSLSLYPHKTIADAAVTAFGRHLWLAELLVGLSFFDNDVSVEEKRLMIASLMDKEGSDEPPKRIPLFSQPSTKVIHDFMTKSTRRLFRILNLPDAFLEVDPSEWTNHEDYTRSQAICRSIRVVNDLAERRVALIQQFNASITRNEEQKAISTTSGGRSSQLVPGTDKGECHQEIKATMTLKKYYSSNDNNCNKLF